MRLFLLFLSDQTTASYHGRAEGVSFAFFMYSIIWDGNVDWWPPLLLHHISFSSLHINHLGTFLLACSARVLASRHIVLRSHWPIMEANGGVRARNGVWRAFACFLFWWLLTRRIGQCPDYERTGGRGIWTGILKTRKSQRRGLRCGLDRFRGITQIGTKQMPKRTW